jgi:superfamily II DNA or RNA helicase
MDLRPHQKECIKSINKHFKKSNKALIKMFCGSGKSFVIYHCLLEYGADISVVVVPSINLITQFNKDYLLDANKKKYNKINFNKSFELLTICSKNELNNEQKKELIFTTEEEKISDFLKNSSDKIILVTYQSLETLIHVIRKIGLQIDLLCFDEAHHIVGDCVRELLFDNQNNEELYLSSDDELNDIESYGNSDCFINQYVNKTLFFTATPKNSNSIMMYNPQTEISMNNKKYKIINDENTCFKEELHCGKLIFEYMHANGVNDGILNDFNIRVDMYTENTDLSIFEAIIRTVLETGNNRVLTFHSRSSESENKKNDVMSFTTNENYKNLQKAYDKIIKNEFPNLVKKYKNIDLIGVTANKIIKNGKKYNPKIKNGESERNYALSEFDEIDDNNICILASCKTIGEGVDTKNANMVVFIDPKQSYVEIIQNIGRICRKNENTIQFSTILIPAYVNADKYKECNGNPEKIDKIIREEMSKCGDFNCILNVLSALRQEDPYVFELCLKYSEVYTKKEINDNLRKNGLVLYDKEYDIVDLLDNYDVIYKSKKTEKENFEKLSKEIKSNIQVTNQKISEEDIVINNGYDKFFYFVKTNDNKYMVAKNNDKIAKGKNVKIGRPNRNIKPVLHINQDIQALWGVKSAIDIGKKVFGGYIESTVIINNEEKSLEKWNNIIERAKKICDEKKIIYENYFPSKSKNEDENNIYSILSNYKTAHNGCKGRSKTYQEIDNLIQKNFPRWLETDLEKALKKWNNIIKQAKEICKEKKIKHENFFPSAMSKNSHEKNIGRILSKYREIHNKDKSKIRGKIYKEVDDLIKGDFPHWLELRTDLEKALEKWNDIIKQAKEICDEKKIKYENYFPSKSNDKKNISNILNNYRGAHYGSKDRGKTYSEVDNLIQEHFPHWLELKNEKTFEKWNNIIKKAKEICNEKKIKYEIYFPSQHSTNSEEKKIGNILNQYRMAHNGKSRRKIYKEVDNLIKENFPHWLDNFKNKQDGIDERISSKKNIEIKSNNQKNTYETTIKKRNTDKQSNFRNNLIKLYGEKCIITDKKRPLEAAHIIPFCEDNNFDVSNGLLMSCDMHKLFDTFDISINPDSMQVELSQELLDDDDYNIYKDKKIIIPTKYENEIKKNLKKHYDDFKFKLNDYIKCKKIKRKSC